MTSFEKVLMRRDGLTAEEAKQEKEEAIQKIDEIATNTGSYSEVEQMLLDDYGLEMDYIMDLI